MKVKEINNLPTELLDQLVDLWEGSVNATHLFLSSEEIAAIKQYVPQGMQTVEHLIVAEAEGQVAAFMGIAGTKLEMLFVDSSRLGQGIGKKLLLYGIEKYGVNEVTVNEQNPKALGFYEHMGFSAYKRTATDEQGGPYPIIYMELKEF